MEQIISAETLKLLLTQGVASALLFMLGVWLVLKGFPQACALIDRIYTRQAQLLERQSEQLAAIANGLAAQTRVLERIEHSLAEFAHHPAQSAINVRSESTSPALVGRRRRVAAAEPPAGN